MLQHQPNCRMPIWITSCIKRCQLLQFQWPAKVFNARLISISFVNRFLVGNNRGPVSADSNKLRLSKQAFHYLIYQLEIAPAFVFSLSRYYLPNGRGYRQLTHSTGGVVQHLWCFLPIRVQSRCVDEGQGHATSTAGSNQLNPLHYLHLEQPGVDIRGSQIALYARFIPKKKSSCVLAICLLDGRWKKIVQQPQSRIDESLRIVDPRSREVLENPFFVFVIYLTTALEWWINALHSFDEQLIAHEESLQKELDTNDKSSSTVYADMNRALHAMSAHLHRYGSELSSTEVIISDLIISHGKAFGTATDAAGSVAKVEASLTEAKGQARTAETMRLELQQKTQNILALLFNRIQLSTDKVMIDNGRSMQGIMVATQAEATSSRILANAQQRLAEEMKEDSVAMKTIAILTMCFLVGNPFSTQFLPVSAEE